MKVFLSVIILAIAIAPVYAALGDQQIVKEYTPGYGWTHIVPMKSNCGGWTDHDLFSYNAATGHTIVSIGPC